MGFAEPDVQRPAPTAGGLPGLVLRRVIEHIDANLHRNPRLTELSAIAHMSPFHFARLFKLSTGLPPHRFAVVRRIERAKGLLDDQAVSVATVARAVGFQTAGHFTTVFRRSTGLTPSAYRVVAREQRREPGPALPAAPRPSGPGVVTLTGAIDALARRGYTADLRAVGGVLRSRRGESLDPRTGAVLGQVPIRR